ncbi:MAG: hypothetical protein ACKVVT_09945 [Dehalococcoidia bacterium]
MAAPAEARTRVGEVRATAGPRALTVVAPAFTSVVPWGELSKVRVGPGELRFTAHTSEVTIVNRAPGAAWERLCQEVVAREGHQPGGTVDAHDGDPGIRFDAAKIGPNRRQVVCNFALPPAMAAVAAALTCGPTQFVVITLGVLFVTGRYLHRLAGVAGEATSPS